MEKKEFLAVLFVCATSIFSRAAGLGPTSPEASSLGSPSSSSDACPSWSKVGALGSAGHAVGIDPSSGKVCVTGITGSYNRAYIACYDNCGNLLAEKEETDFGQVVSAGYGHGATLAIKSLSEIYVGGIAFSGDGGEHYAWVKKYQLSSSGLTSLWSRYFEPDNEHRSSWIKDIALGSDGSIYIAGEARKGLDSLNHPPRLWVKRLTTNGNIMDSHGYEPTPVALAFCSSAGITLDPAGRVYLIGTIPTMANNNKNFKIWIGRINAKLDSFDSHKYFDYGAGETLTDGGDQGLGILRVFAGGKNILYATGGAKPTSASAPSLWIAYSTETPANTFSVLAAPANNFTYDMVGNDLAADALGNLYVIGTVKGPNQKIAVRKYSAHPALTPQWTKTFDSGSAHIDEGNSIAVGNAVFFTGRHGSRLWLKKCPLSGCG